MLVSEFDYELPAELIAQHPAPQRSASRLLHLRRRSGALRDLKFTDLPQLLGPDDVLVLNDTRVIKARLAGRKASGGKIELFVERTLGAHEALALIRASHPPGPGASSSSQDGSRGSRPRGRALPRALRRARRRRARALRRGAAAALHQARAAGRRTRSATRPCTPQVPAPSPRRRPGCTSTRHLLRRIEDRGATIAKLTLHVGAGTFQPVRVDEVEEHRMHSERYNIPEETLKAIAGQARARRRHDLAARAREPCADRKADGETDLFITRASSSAWSSACSPTSTCRNPRC